MWTDNYDLREALELVMLFSCGDYVTLGASKIGEFVIVSGLVCCCKKSFCKASRMSAFFLLTNKSIFAFNFDRCNGMSCVGSLLIG